jgi:hypothetical protein
MQGSAKLRGDTGGLRIPRPNVRKPSRDELQEKLLGYAAEVTISRPFFA